MAMTPGAAAPRIFYGWWVALALSIIVLLSSGIRFTIGPFLKPVTADLGVDRGSFSLVVAASLLLYGAFMPLVGRLVDRIGARVVCAGGAFVMAASLGLTGRMTTLWEFYLYYAVIGSLGLAATGHVTGSVMRARWFVRHRGVTMSSLGSASMAGMAVLVPAAMWSILRYGWRLLLLVAAIGGVGMSGSLAMTSALTGDLFGRYSVGSLFGLIFLSHQAGAALGSWLGGALFDLTGGYGAAFAVAAALLLIAAGLSLAINETARPASRTVPLPGRPYPVAGGR